MKIFARACNRLSVCLLACLVFIPALCLNPTTMVSAEEMPVVTVATDATWPPMEMVDENKQIVGFAIDYFNAVAEEAGFKIKFKNVAWDGIFAGIGIGRYDMIVSSVTITEERKQKMDFSEPYLNAGQILVVPRSTPNRIILTGMIGKKLGAQIGTTGAFAIKETKGVTLKSYDEVGLAFEDMAAGRIDGVVCDTPVAANYALQKAEYQDKFKIVGQSFTEEYYGAVVKKGNTQLLEMVNRGIRAVKAKGIDKELENKWLR